MDPLAEKYPDISSYVYCHDNPINLIDPNGMEDVENEHLKEKWRSFDTKKDKVVLNEAIVSAKKLSWIERKIIRPLGRFLSSIKDEQNYGELNIGGKGQGVKTKAKVYGPILDTGEFQKDGADVVIGWIKSIIDNKQPSSSSVEDQNEEPAKQIDENLKSENPEPDRYVIYSQDGLTWVKNYGGSSGHFNERRDTVIKDSVNSRLKTLRKRTGIMKETIQTRKL